MKQERKMPAPEEIQRAIPLSPEAEAAKAIRDREISDILTGKDQNRMLLIIGPCSADREDAVLDYIHRLAPIQEEVRDKLLIVPRIYTNKPRTTGDGYKGIASQPDPTERPDMVKGLMSLRHLHVQAVNDTGLTCADEMLYPDNHYYLADVLSYVAVGARSVENQQHRLVASGVGMPVGMKNPTSGDFSVMLNSITAAQHPHVFAFCGWEVETSGNPLAHAILRGYVDNVGRTQPNYHYEDLISLYDAYSAKGLQNMGVIVDANHANSGKQYLQQVRICNEVLHSCRHSRDIRSFVKGFMVESYLEDGSQKIGEGIYGKSITDPCLGWEKSRELIYNLADQL
ncbi:MAG: 3-deoxy-7-phosphoheptulonate synthase [Oscillospiraceae bacterium]|nr:3-deoxy-7-phosphoheptulonate synthase [Oscillospiraceae bacterium]